MKISLITKPLMLALLACLALFSVPPVQGLSQNEIILSFNWSKSTHYQGDSGSVTISLHSTCGNELEFTWVGVHFAWMQENYYYTLDLSGNPVKIPSGGSCTFSAIGFGVSSSASVGWNEYYVRILYDEHYWYGWASGTWTSPTYRIYIHDAYEEIYNELRPKVLSAINDAQRANYESPDAKSLLSQAINEYNIAVSLANQENWKDAVSHLQNASNLLVQASAKEEEYQYQKQQRELETWRQKALDSINIANQKINQLKGCECSDAKLILEQAQIQLTNAQNSFNRATLEGYQDAYDYALRASSYADEAAIREQEYQQNKQITSELIGRAEEKIDQIKNVENVEAKVLLQKALDELKRAKDAYNQKTIEGCKTACSIAQQAIAYAEQAYAKEQTYQQQKQQLILIGGVISAIVIVAIVGVVLTRRKRKSVTTT